MPVPRRPPTNAECRGGASDSRGGNTNCASATTKEAAQGIVLHYVEALRIPGQRQNQKISRPDTHASDQLLRQALDINATHDISAAIAWLSRRQEKSVGLTIAA